MRGLFDRRALIRIGPVQTSLVRIGLFQIGLGLVLIAGSLSLAAPATAQTKDEIGQAHRLAHLIHTFHDEDYYPSNYCEVLYAAEQLKSKLRGSNSFAGTWAADQLYEELEEEYWDSDYWCPPPWFAAFGGYSGPTSISNWTGVYVGVQGGWITGTSRVDEGLFSTGSFDAKGGLFGPTVGFNYQTGPFVVGLQGTYTWSDVKANSDILDTRVTSLFVTQARFGYALGNNVLASVNVGPAFATMDKSFSAFEQFESQQWGVAYGVSVEAMVDRNWSVFFKYDRLSFKGTNCINPCQAAPAADLNKFSAGFNVNFSWTAGTMPNIRSSDARLKRDIVALGHLDNGLALYRFRYEGSDQIYVGVMAQEVQMIRPDAVVHGDDGFLLVDYGRLGLHMQSWDEWAASPQAASLAGAR